MFDPLVFAPFRVQHDTVHDDPQAQDGQQATMTIVHTSSNRPVLDLSRHVRQAQKPQNHAAAMLFLLPHDGQEQEDDSTQPRAKHFASTGDMPEAFQALWDGSIAKKEKRSL